MKSKISYDSFFDINKTKLNFRNTLEMKNTAAFTIKNLNVEFKIKDVEEK